MTQTMHIVRKDVRRLRWLLLLWIGILAARVLLRTSGPMIAGEGVGGAIALQQLGSVVATLELLLTALMASRLVHDEALVGLNAFWLTRPYDRGSLLAAKLLFAGVVLIVTPFIADVIMMSLFGAGSAAHLRAGPVLLGGYLRWTLAFLVVAVLTPSTTAFVLTIVGIAASLSALFAIVLTVAVWFVGESEGYRPSFTPDLTPLVVGFVVYVAAALAVVTYQYRRRRWPTGAALVALGVVAMIAVPSVWPWSFLRGVEPDPGSWARDTTATTVALEPRLHAIRQPFGDANAEPKRQVHARVRLTGMPAHFSVTSVGARTTLELLSGVTLRSEQMQAFSEPVAPSPAQAGPPTPLQAALGDTRLIGWEDPQFEMWPALITLTDEEFARYRNQAGRLNAILDFYLSKMQVVGTLPLTAGAALDDGFSRVEIMSVQPRVDSVVVAVRRWRAEGVLSTERGNGLEFVLRNRARKEAHGGSAESFGPHMNAGGSAMLGLFLGAGFSVAASESGFIVNHEVVQFPGRRARSIAIATAVIDESWLADAELVVVKNEYAGYVTRTLIVEGFTIPGQ